jgi:phosphatidylinositol alpha-1,6-mannosyltransferase
MANWLAGRHNLNRYRMPQQTKALFLTRKYPPSVGGMETYSRSLYEEMKGIDPQIDLLKPGSDILGRPSTWRMCKFLAGAAGRLLLRARDYDVVLLGDYAIASLAIIAKLVTFGRIRTVVSLHGNDLYFMRHRSVKAFAYRAVSWLVVRSKCLDAAIANSSAIKEEAASRGISNITIIPLATTIPNFLKRDHPISEGTFRLLFTGRLIRYKGLSWFLREVWPKLDERFELWVAGTVWDEPELSALKAAPRVKYLGAIPHEKLPELRATMVACIMPNIPPSATEQDEGFGLVALESPAVGTPIIASRCGGIPDAIADSVTGFLLPPLDSSQWADCLTNVAAWAQEERDEFATRARQFIMDNYNWNLVAQRTLKVLRPGP